MNRAEIQKASLLVLQWLAFCAMAVILWVSAGSRTSTREVLTILATVLGGVSILWLVRAGWQFAHRQSATGSQFTKSLVGVTLGMVFFVIAFILDRLLYDPVRAWLFGNSSSTRFLVRMSAVAGGWAFFLTMLAFAFSVAILVKPKTR